MVSFYERDVNDVNRRQAFGNDMSRCSVFFNKWKIRVVKFVRFLVL